MCSLGQKGQNGTCNCRCKHVGNSQWLKTYRLANQLNMHVFRLSYRDGHWKVFDWHFRCLVCSLPVHNSLNTSWYVIANSLYASTANIKWIKLFFYRVMLCRVRLWDCMSSVRPSVRLSVCLWRSGTVITYLTPFDSCLPCLGLEVTSN